MQKITDSDPRFQTLEHGYNLRWPSPGKGPSTLYVCRTEGEIIGALADALETFGPADTAGSSITVRSGGHCYEAFVSDNNGGAIIDVGLYGGVVSVDDRERYFPRIEELRAAAEVDRRLAEAVPSERPDPAAAWKEIQVPEDQPQLERELTSADGAVGFKILPGTMNWDGYVGLYKLFGRTIPGGSCYSVGAGGHISGGGYGLLSRAHGLTTDWLTGVEVIVARDGKTPTKVLATPTLNRELYLLCAGAGGGNVGIITAYYFKDLPPAPTKATLLFQSIPWTQFTDDGGRQQFVGLLKRYGDFFTTGPGRLPEYDGLFALLHVTPQVAESITLTLQACELPGCVAPDVALETFVDDVLARASTTPVRTVPATGTQRAGHAFVQVPKPESMTTRTSVPGAIEMDWLTATQYVNGSGHNRRGKYKSAYLIDVSDSYAEGLYDAMTGALQRTSAAGADGSMSESPLDVSECLVQIDSYGGQINRVPDFVNSVVQRRSHLKVQYQAYWSDPGHDTAYVGWLRDVYAATFADGCRRTPYPYVSIGALQRSPHYEGCYINYPDVDMVDAFGTESSVDGIPTWMVLYYGRDLPRMLIGAKRAWDPWNVFHHAMSIPLDIVRDDQMGHL